MDTNISRKIRYLLEDNILSPEEAHELIKEYDQIRWKSDLEIKQWLNQHGYDIKLKNYSVNITPNTHDKKLMQENARLHKRLRAIQMEEQRLKELAGSEKRWPAPRTVDDEVVAGIWRDAFPEPKLPKLPPGKKQKLIWLAIVGPAAIASLILL